VFALRRRGGAGLSLDRYREAIPPQPIKLQCSDSLDASAAYDVTYEQTLTPEGINPMDEVSTRSDGIRNLVPVRRHTGRRFFAGFRYRL